jgi:hypothetical protein
MTRWTSWRGSLSASVVLFVLTLLAAGPLEAHPRGPQVPESSVPVAPAVPSESIREPQAPPPSLVAAPGGPLPSWLVPVIALAVAGAMTRRSPRATAAVVLALLAMFAAESSLHSVHHLGDPRGAEQCLVLSFSQHLSADCPFPHATPLLVRARGGTVVLARAARPVVFPLRPDQGRAPPAFPA